MSLDRNEAKLDKVLDILDKYKAKPGEHKVKMIGFHVKLIPYRQKRAETK